jgi:TolA-binding protein
VSLPSTPTKAGNDSTQLQTLLDKIQQLQKRIVDMESSYKLQVDVLKTEVLELSREKRREGLNMGCVLCVQFCDSSQNASFCAVI